MTVYAEKTAINLLDGATDPEGDALTIGEVNGATPGSWPHAVTVSGRRFLVYQDGTVTHDDEGDTSDHPAAGATASNGNFTFRATDGALLSNLGTASLTLEGATSQVPSGSISKGIGTPDGTQYTPTLYADPAATGANNGTSWADAYTSLQTGITAMASQADGAVLTARGKFRESIDLGSNTSGGSSGSPKVVTCEGGTPFEVSAAELHTSWTACADQADALGNTNWASMVTATIPLSSIVNSEALGLNLFKDGVRQELAIDALTNDSDARFFNRNEDNMHTADSFTTTSMTDASVIGAYSAGDLDDAYVLAHFSTGNNVATRAITSHSGNTVNFSSVSSADGKFALWNVPKKISAAGQWAFQVNGANVKVVAWFDNTDYSNVEYTARDHCVNQSWSNHWHFHGMICRQWAGDVDKSVGFGAKNNNHIRKSGITLEHCRFTGGFGYGQNMGISLSLWNNQDSGAQYVTIDDNQNCQGSYIAGGSGSTGTDNYLRNFIIDRVGGSGLRPHIVERFRAVDGEITDIKGSHANGASIYQDSFDVLFLRIKIRTGRGIGLTHQESNNLWFIHCDIECPEFETNGNRAFESNGTNACRNLGDSSVRSGVMRYLNCTAGPWAGATSTDYASAFIPCKTGGTTSLVVLNSVGFGGIDPLPRTSASYDANEPIYEVVNNNHLNGRVIGQDLTDPFFVGGSYVAGTGDMSNNVPLYANNTHSDDPATDFVDYTTGDFRPKASGPLDGTGVNVKAAVDETGSGSVNYIDVGAWATVENFDIDINGNAVNWTGTVHMGAYQDVA